MVVVAAVAPPTAGTSLCRRLAGMLARWESSLALKAGAGCRCSSLISPGSGGRDGALAGLATDSTGVTVADFVAALAARVLIWEAPATIRLTALSVIMR